MRRNRTFGSALVLVALCGCSAPLDVGELRPQSIEGEGGSAQNSPTHFTSAEGGSAAAGASAAGGSSSVAVTTPEAVPAPTDDCFSPTQNLDKAQTKGASGCACQPGTPNRCLNGIALVCAKGTWRAYSGVQCFSEANPDQEFLSQIAPNDCGIQSDYFTRGELNRTFDRNTWDPVRRIRTRETSETPQFSGGPEQLWRYDAAGKEIAYSDTPSPEANAQLMHIDTTYDDHGNLLARVDSSPPNIDLMAPSTAATTHATRVTSEYDLQGRLLVSSSVSENYEGNKVTSFDGGRNVFHEDALGRCDQISYFLDPNVSEVTRYTYDSLGHVVRTVVTPAPGLADTYDSETVDFTYDEKGRQTSRATWYNSARGDVLSAISTYEYGADGSRREQTFDALDTESGLGILNVVKTRTAGCALIEAAIGVPPDQRCRVEQGWGGISE